MLKTQEEHRCKFQCPIRHPSRDITKIRFHIKSSVFDKKKWGKWHFCDARLNFTFFDLKIKPRIGTARAKKNWNPAFFSLFFLRQVMVAFVFFRIVISVISLRQKQKTYKAGFQLEGWCTINIVSQNHTQIGKLSGAWPIYLPGSYLAGSARILTRS